MKLISHKHPFIFIPLEFYPCISIFMRIFMLEYILIKNKSF